MNQTKTSPTSATIGNRYVADTIVLASGLLVGCLAWVALAGLLLNSARPDGLALSQAIAEETLSPSEACVALPAQARVDVSEALRLHRAGEAAFADVRSADAYASGHIADAFHLPCSSDTPEWLGGIPRSMTVVVYGADGGSDQVAQALIASGYREVRVLDGGFAAWSEAYGPAQAGDCQACE